MEALRFDRLARALVATSTRRALLALGVAYLLGALGQNAADAKKKGKNKKKCKQCGPCQKCKKGKCKPVAAGTPCGEGKQCFANGECVACDVCLGDCDSTSLQDAVTAANAGARIQICPGTFTTTHVIVNKKLTVIGAGSGKGGTVLSGRGKDRVLRFVNADVDVRHLTISGGAVENSGAGIAGSQSDITLEDVHVTGNHSGSEGGGIYAHTCTVTLVDSHVTDNSADNGGGIYVFGTLLLTAGSIVTGNRATGGPESAGGIASIAPESVEITNGGRVFDNDPIDCTGTTACGTAGHG